MPALTTQNVRASFIAEAELRKPCGPSSDFHVLVCGHTIRAKEAPCGANCANEGKAERFVCWKCLIKAQSYASEQKLSQGRPSDFSGADTWLEEFFAMFPEAYEEQQRSQGRRETRHGWQAMEVRRELDRAVSRSWYDRRASK